jgi:hypothetical protein
LARGDKHVAQKAKTPRAKANIVDCMLSLSATTKLKRGNRA